MKNISNFAFISDNLRNIVWTTCTTLMHSILN